VSYLWSPLSDGIEVIAPASSNGAGHPGFWSSRWGFESSPAQYFRKMIGCVFLFYVILKFVSAKQMILEHPSQALYFRYPSNNQPAGSRHKLGVMAPLWGKVTVQQFLMEESLCQISAKYSGEDILLFNYSSSG